MPFVLYHTHSRQIFTCRLINHYQLAYYGVKYWDHEEDAMEQAQPFLETVEAGDWNEWQVMELEDTQLKLCNVKLKNDPNLQLIWSEEQRPEVKKIL